MREREGVNNAAYADNPHIREQQLKVRLKLEIYSSLNNSIWIGEFSHNSLHTEERQAGRLSQIKSSRMLLCVINNKPQRCSLEGRIIEMNKKS